MPDGIYFLACFEPRLIEKEFDGALPCWDDMVRAERLQRAVLKSAFEGNSDNYERDIEVRVLE